MNFDSGWEWGYWLSDVVTARASWDPLLSPRLKQPKEEQQQGSGASARDSEQQGYAEHEDQWEAFGVALLPVTRIFGPRLGPAVNALIVRLARSQAELLVFGRVDGKPSPNLKKLSGIAYMSGQDSWVDFPRMFGLPLLQPDKVNTQTHTQTDTHHMYFTLVSFCLLREVSEISSLLSPHTGSLKGDAGSRSASRAAAAGGHRGGVRRGRRGDVGATAGC